MNLVGKLLGVIVLLCLLPTIALVTLDVVRITLASLPWWVMASLVAAVVVAAVALLSMTLRMIGLMPPRRYHHDHWHHKGTGW